MTKSSIGSSGLKMAFNSTYGALPQMQGRLLRNESAGVDVTMIRPRGTKVESLRSREQITPEGEAKFLFGDIKRSVYIRTDRELMFLSRYIGISCKEYFADYFGGNKTVTPIIVKCDFRLSLSGEMGNSVFSNLGAFMGGKTFNEQKREALSLEAFLNPDAHLEEFI